jgi:tRNA pseudouridine38-40 synthase
MRLKLLLQYDGRGLYGWQAQQAQHEREFPSVQGHLAAAFHQLIQEDVEPVAAGRTDAGVHAVGQVVHVDVAKKMPLIKYLDGLNRFLPAQIRVARVAAVGEDFHARYSATRRRYRYLLWNSRQLRPDLAGRVGLVRRPLEVGKMAAALKKLPLGEHDFSSYRDAECQARTPVCRLIGRRLTVGEEPLGGRLVAVDWTADHFLHHMVRNLMGTLVQIGQGKRPAEDLARLLEKKDRRLAGPTFAPDGLYLMGVDYPRHRESDVVGVE